ncbi:MAG: DUF3240 domain-containing protein [Gammaproteobacteria bacterium]|nr:MAG: DUF3240 domain-containing protein [Gammaproteobacteria bacterium]
MFRSLSRPCRERSCLRSRSSSPVPRTPMSDVLLSLAMPAEAAQPVEDLLLSRPDLVPGFTSSHAEGHGSTATLVEPAELVEGHSARVIIRMVGSQRAMLEVLQLVRAELPGLNVFYWLVPVLEKGRL